MGPGVHCRTKLTKHGFKGTKRVHGVHTGAAVRPQVPQGCPQRWAGRSSSGCKDTDLTRRWVWMQHQPASGRCAEPPGLKARGTSRNVMVV